MKAKEGRLTGGAGDRRHKALTFLPVSRSPRHCFYSIMLSIEPAWPFCGTGFAAAEPP